jgi:hypothetical protein
MIETDQSLQQAQIRTRLRAATKTLARYEAIKAVKRELQAKGLKPSHFAHREIAAAAEDYLSQHPQLIAEARETVIRWQAEGVFGKRGGIRNPVRKASENERQINDRSPA